MNRFEAANSNSFHLIRRIQPLPDGMLLGLHAANPQRYPVLLQSAAVQSGARQFDILLGFPGERLTLQANGLRRGDKAIPVGGFLPALDQWWRELRLPQSHTDAFLPFLGGWFLFLGYELAAEIEPSLQLAAAPEQVIAEAVRMPAALIRDSRSGESWIVAEADSATLVELIASDLKNLNVNAIETPNVLIAEQLVEEAPEIYLQAVAAVLERIAAGDIYQANLSRAWQARLAASAPAYELYRRLCASNPAPFAGLALLDACAIISSSPERLIQIRDGWVNTRPIAGTRPRSANVMQDKALLRELRAHPKEQAEHVMLLDLERNDLGRICEPGSVKVDEFMSVESYAHVHHLVSNVRGRVRNDIAPGQAIAAVFPGGTITGCPKVRCMSIIAALEQSPRGAYTGSMGYLNRDGTMDLNILIRTLTLEQQRIVFRAGAGIVADSEPQRELEETRAKALGMVRALRGAAI